MGADSWHALADAAQQPRPKNPPPPAPPSKTIPASTPTPAQKADASSSEIAPIPTRVWQPGADTLEDGEELQSDPSAYNSLHGFHVGCPCLSRYIFCDDFFGEESISYEIFAGPFSVIDEHFNHVLSNCF